MRNVHHSLFALEKHQFHVDTEVEWGRLLRTDPLAYDGGKLDNNRRHMWVPLRAFLTAYWPSRERAHTTSLERCVLEIARSIGRAW